MKQDKTPTTVIQWLEKAKADGYEWADAAIANCTSKEQEVGSMIEALRLAFNWRRSQQGFWYWNAAIDSIKE